MSLSLQSVAISADWGTGCQATLTLINNTSQAIGNWSFTLTASANVQSLSFYDLQCVKNGTNYIITPQSWTLAIPPANTISSGFGCVYNGSKPTFSAGSPTPIPPTPTPGKKYDGWNSTSNGKNAVYYHTNWSTYARDFQVCDLPIDYIPTIAYAFYNLNADGNIITGDSYADTDKVFTTRSVAPADSWSDGLAYHGNFGQFLKLKEAGKKFNLVLSIGGWTWSANMSVAMSTATNRINMINSILALFNKYPIFAGVNIDWEYLSNDGVNYGNVGNGVTPQDSDNFVAFIRQLRQALNSNGKSTYKISLACTADPSKLKFPVKEIDAILDEWHCMTYDFADGNWGTKIATHNTNLYPAPYTTFSVSGAIEAYIAAEATSSKLLIGVALYSRGFANTTGLGSSANGGSPDMSWEAGICDYKSLPRTGAQEFWDDTCKAGYSYDATKKIFNSYDTVQSIQEKCKYVNNNGLGGIIAWETSGDVPSTNSRSLTKAIYNSLFSGVLPPPTPQTKVFPITANKIELTLAPKFGTLVINMQLKQFEYTPTGIMQNDSFTYLNINANTQVVVNVN